MIDNVIDAVFSNIFLTKIFEEKQDGRQKIKLDEPLIFLARAGPLSRET